MVSSSPLISGAKFRFFIMRRISASGTSIPSTPFTLLTLTVIGVGSMEFPVFTSKWVRETLPQPSSSIRCNARFIPSTVEYSSTPFSYLALASVAFPSARAVFLTLSRANFADSNITASVVSRISEFKPPMTPASATGFTPSQITRLFSFIVYSCSSRVTIFSFSFALLTQISLPSR